MPVQVTDRCMNMIIVSQKNTIGNRFQSYFDLNLLSSTRYSCLFDFCALHVGPLSEVGHAIEYMVGSYSDVVGLA